MPDRLGLPTAILVCLIGLAAAGCTSEPELVGRMGITADATGQPVLVLEPCGGSIDEITLSLLPFGKQTESGDVGSWRAASKVTALTHLALAGDNPGWAGATVLLDPAKHYIAQALSTTHPNDAFNDVTFEGSQVAKLDPSKVYVNSDDPDSTALVPAGPVTC